MKRFEWILLLLIVATPVWSASYKKMSVEEMRDMLTSLQHAQKSDDDVATQLKQIELTEELTAATMNSMAGLIPGPLSTEQMYVLEARSAMLAPPAADLPTAPAPDAAAQQAMLTKAADYAKSYPQLPHLTATRMTARFQDGVGAMQDSGMKRAITSSSDPVLIETSLYVRLMNTHTDQIESENGIEKQPAKDKTQWGMNGIVTSVTPAQPVNTVVQDAMANGSPKWLRWESINNVRVAVFSFAIEKKKTRYAVNYCCFPDTDTAGNVNYQMSHSSPGASVKGNLQTASDWKNFKTTSGYHGELFIDPDSGVVVRTITEAEFKPSDFVHFEDLRVDYAPMPIGGKNMVVPVRSFAITEIVPNGDSFAAHYSVRHDFVTEDYKDYQQAGGAAGTSSIREDDKPLIDNSGKRMIQAINADVLAARAANRDKRYADAEAIILKDTVSKSDLILPWIELGLAQIGLKKYTEAETDFKTALAIDPRSPKSQRDIEDTLHPAHSAGRATVSYTISEQDRAPDVIGIIDSSLGEIYIRTNRTPEAEAAFDAAAEANPARAGFYLRNETLFFFQTGNTEAQLKAAEKAIAADANGAVPYYFKAQALVSKATVDPKTQKMTLPPDCAEAYQKYLQLEPNGQFSADAKGILSAAGVQVASNAKK
jgi:tetratricopeptide (TPR) repeat protein